MQYSAAVIEAAQRLNISPEAVQTYLDAGRGVRATGVERCFHTTLKPIGSACDLDCTYCYYRHKQALLSQPPEQRMTDDTLERFIVEYIAAQDTDEIVFTWHGGEPTLLGLAFFRRVVEFQIRHTPAGRRLANDIQTNGILLDAAWCRFFSEHGWLVGLSIDGPSDLNDAYRVTKRGDPTQQRVLAAARLLDEHDVTFSTLTTVNRRNASHPIEVYRFLRDELRTRYVQLLPCVEPRQFESVAPGHLPVGELVPADDPRARPGHPRSVVTDFSVDPDEWGGFLCQVFDEWRKHDQGRVKVNLFESIFAQLQGRPALLCSNSPICGKNIVLESDGRIYACDHFVYPEYQIGCLGQGPLAETFFSLRQLEFGLNKHNSLPADCRACRYLRLCWGECPRTRLLRTGDGEGNLSYLCSGWKAFFRHALRYVGPESRAPCSQAPGNAI
jgi:uncharacterized protein